MLVFITGGARSGKSTDALEAARHSGRAVVFIATATAGDEEMGSGIVPATALGRSFRDLLGRANQRVAAAADQAVVSVAGRLIELGARSESFRV